MKKIAPGLLLLSIPLLTINLDSVNAQDYSLFGKEIIGYNGTMSFNTTLELTPIAQKYQELGGSNSFLGQPLGPETNASDGRGSFQDFRGGAIYWSPETGAHEVHGSILQKYREFGAEQNPNLGYPVTDEIDTPPYNYCPCFSVFKNGVIYAEVEPFFIFGPIWDKYIEKKSVLGSPVGDTATRDQTGFFNSFQSGMVYWNQYRGSHEVHGSILQKYLELDAELGWLGYPTSDENGSFGGCPCYSTFVGGVIYTNAYTDWIPQATDDFAILERPEVDPEGCPKCD